MEQVKLLSLTAVLTALVWAGANSLVNEIGHVRVRFDVSAKPGSDLLVEFAPAAATQLFELQVLGPRKVVEKLQTLAPSTYLLLVDDRSLGASDFLLDPEAIESSLRSHRKEFESIHVVSVRPNRLPIVVDRMVTVEGSVVAKRLSLTYEDAPHVSPNTVSVRMRESILLESGQADGRLTIDISVELERLLKNKPAGQSTKVAVTLDANPFGRKARFTPDRVEVTATVKADRSTIEVPTVPIRPVISFANLAKPLVAVARDGTPLELVTQAITVTGPTDDVAKLARGETRAFGLIQLKEADFEELGVLMSRTPEFYLPPGIRLARETSPIEFKLVLAENADIFPKKGVR